VIRPGFDTCGGDGCGVTSNLHPFPHLATCRYGDGHPPVCTCQHPASAHEIGPDGQRCHSCFMEGAPSHHPYTPARQQ
jgi:hypothetical protein